MRLNLPSLLAALLLGAATLLLLAPPAAAFHDDVDLEPYNLTIDPDAPVVREVFSGTFDVRNNGIEPATNVTILVFNSTSACEIDDGCDVVYDETEGVLGGGKSITVEFDWFDGAEGDRTFSVYIDWNDDITETDEENNDFFFDFHVFGEPTAELEFIEGSTVIATPPDPAEGDVVDLLVLFQNSGRADAAQFYVTFQDILDGDTSTIETLEVSNVWAGSPAQVNITWRPDAVGNHTVRVILDSQDDLEEVDEDNNVFDFSIYVHPHTPELTLDLSYGLVADPLDEWLDDVFQNHAINISVMVLNVDVVEAASDVRVRFWDQPENGSAIEIADFIIPAVSNATEMGFNQFPGRAEAWVVWDLNSGTSIVGNHTIIIEVDPLNAIDEWNDEDNRHSFNVTVREPRPDLEVTTIAVAGEPARGIPSEVTVTLFNGGATAVSSAYVELRVDGRLVSSWNVTLQEGASVDLRYDYTWAESNPSVMGYADPEKQVEELDESNNYRSILVPIATPRHDLAVIGISHSEEAFTGQRVELRVKLQNHLSLVEEFRIRLYLDGADAPERLVPSQELYYVSGYRLEYNESREISIWWYDTHGEGWHNLSVMAEVVDYTYPDENETNNHFTTPFYLKRIQYQLSLEMEPLPGKIQLNETIRVIVHAFNFGQDILSAGAEVDVWGNNASCGDPSIQRTRELDRATGEDILEFFCTPNASGLYIIVAMVDPDNIHDEPNEDDNFATGVVNVTNEEFTPVVPPVIQDDSFITQPIVWVPLATLAVIGAGMFAYYRLRDDDDFLSGTRRQSGDSAPGQASSATTFRYDAESGITYDAETGEVIGEKKDYDAETGEKKDYDAETGEKKD